MSVSVIRKVLSVIMIMIMLNVTVTYFYMPAKREVQAEKKQDYLVVTENFYDLNNLGVDSKVDTIVKESLVNGQNVGVVSLTAKEVKRIKDRKEIISIEKDNVVTASKTFGGRKVIRKQENLKKQKRWNTEIIKVNKVEKSQKVDKIKVAILDSGIDYANDIDIKESINFVDNGEVSPLYVDITGHGSSVAGIIAAKDNAEGITGINPDVELYSAKILDDKNTAPISRVIEGIYWAIDKKVDIINLSFGTEVDSVALQTAIRDAYGKGILLIAAAGNHADKIEYPAAYEEVMAVGSVSGDGSISDFSANGECMEIVAPGEKITSTGGFGGVVVCSGTSMAVPHVVGVASLVWQRDRTMTNEFVRALLDASANSFGNQDYYGNGLLDAEQAMKNYDEFKTAYKKDESIINTDYVVPENTSSISEYNTDEYVDGSWSYNAHNNSVSNESLSAAEISIVKTGINYPDSSQSGVKGLRSFPEWHGGYKSDNYIGSYIYVADLARAIQYGTELRTVYAPGGIGGEEKKNLLNAVQNVDWNQMLPTPSTRNKVLFVWGMALHTATDSFAHNSWASVYCKVEKKQKWEHLDHSEKSSGEPVHNGYADDIDRFPNRYETASRVARKSLKKLVGGQYADVKDFLPEGGYQNAGSKWTIRGLSDCARALPNCNASIFDTLYQYTEAPIYHSYYQSNK